MPGVDRPITSATWDSNDARAGATFSAAAAKAPSPDDRLSPNPSKKDKQRFSFLTRKSAQDVNAGNHNSGSITALPTMNGRPSREIVPASPRIGQANGARTSHDKNGAMGPSSVSNEDKLQKHFGIPESQYRASPPELDQRQHNARKLSNSVQPAPATGQYNASPPLSQQEERPNTRQSSRSTQDTLGGKSGGGSSIGSRVGSVKKRLSILGIGKKASKSSVRSRGQPESLIEE